MCAKADESLKGEVVVGVYKVVGRSTSLAWPGWKQKEILVKADWQDS